jgi:hypothetical protein
VYLNGVNPKFYHLMGRALSIGRGDIRQATPAIAV